MPSALAPIAGAVVGGLMGGDGPDQTQTTSKDPWSEAAPWIKDNIGIGQRLQNFYQQNPFNAIQQNAIGQTLNDQDYYRNTLMPGLMAFLGQPRAAGSSLSAMGIPQNAGQGGQNAGLLGAGQGGSLQSLFQVPQASNQAGLIDWAALNPHSAQNNPAPPAQDLGDVDAFRQMMGRAMFADTSPQQAVWEDNITPTERWMRQQLGRPDNRMVRYSGG